MFHLLMYNKNNSGPANNFDLNAATDPSFSIRNNHYILTEAYRFLYLSAWSAHITDARIVSPQINALCSDGFRIAGFNVAAGVGGAPTLYDKWTDMQIPVPQNEEIQFQASTGTAEQQWGAALIGTQDWNRNIPSVGGVNPGTIQGMPIVLEATTASFTPTVNVWSADQALVFNSNPRGGVYIVIGAALQQAADTVAFRINFVRTKLYQGRKLFPGWFAQNVVGQFEDVITQVNRFHLGNWGAFHTFEPPLLAVFPSTSAAMTPILRLWCVYMGGQESLLSQYV
jgi:hypothetical protein